MERHSNNPGVYSQMLETGKCEGLFEFEISNWSEGLAWVWKICGGLFGIWYIRFDLKQNTGLLFLCQKKKKKEEKLLGITFDPLDFFGIQL